VEPLLDRVHAQQTAITTLRRALASGRVHHAYLFDGPNGVGKEMAAFGLAQALVCERPSAENGACGTCSACGRAIVREGEARPLHPDVVVLERGLYEPAQIGRRTPETQDISIDQVRTLVLARAAFGAHEGRAKVFIVRRAEEMNASAANALLKTLEEPGKNTYFILLSSLADQLLPTVRSRAQRVRFGPLPEKVVARVLEGRGVEARRAEEAARMSGGSVETALALADAEQSAARDHFVSNALAAVDAADLAPALELAEEAKKTPAQTGAVARGQLAVWIGALASALAARAARAAAASDESADVLVARHRLAVLALEQLDGNASPQLVVESMLVRMRSAAPGT
jgi:DNA polymerase-3 subunit delta'